MGGHWPKKLSYTTHHRKAPVRIPISIEGRFWGFIGFDDCHYERIWTSNDISILQAAAASIGGAIARKEVEEDLIKAKDAAEKLVRTNMTRLGVYEKDKLIGWVTLAALGGECSKESLIDHLHRRHKPEPDEILCPVCRLASLTKVSDKDGNIEYWECSNCGHRE